MSTLPGGFSPSPDDARLELTMAAMRAERRNRPRMLLVLAALILVAAVVNLLWTFTKRATADAGLSRVSASLANVKIVVDQLKTLEEKRLSPKYAIDNDMDGKLMRFASETIGLTRPEIQVRPGSSGVKGFTKRLYPGTITEADPAMLLRWVSEATDGRLPQFAGLEVETLTLKPGRTLESGKVGWTLTVTFRRWERTS